MADFFSICVSPFRSRTTNSINRICLLLNSALVLWDIVTLLVLWGFQTLIIYIRTNIINFDIVITRFRTMCTSGFFMCMLNQVTNKLFQALWIKRVVVMQYLWVQSLVQIVHTDSVKIERVTTVHYQIRARRDIPRHGQHNENNLLLQIK